jgi:hypothetical protein
MNIYKVEYNSNDNSPYAYDYLGLVITAESEDQAMKLFEGYMSNDMLSPIEQKNTISIKQISDCTESKVLDCEQIRYNY